MKDQDIINEEERHEAATETPIGESKSEVEVEERNVPLAHFPSGADGTEPGGEPDYEMLARELTRDGFDSERLAKAIEALASEKPVDYPTFYTPGWLVDLAKKIEAQSANHQIPQVVRPQTLSDIGMVMDKCVSKDENGIVTRIHYAGIRHVDAKRAAQLWEIDVAKDDNGSHITCWRDHERVFSGEAFFGLFHAADVAISMMIRKIIGDTAKKHRDHFRNIRRATAETKAIIEKELA